MLHIKNLKAKIADNDEVLHGINLNIKAGEVHAVMGPNGSGKSTLANVLAGCDGYIVTGGSIKFFDEDLTALTVEERAGKGLFLGMQNPVEIPGVNNMYFLRTALNSVLRRQNKDEVDAFDFMKLVKEKMHTLGFKEDFLERAVNDGFSGGEKKRNEILQMMLLEPKMIVLDEIDSGLDIDALQQVADGINSLRNPNRAILLITHYQRLLHYIVPDYVHVLAQGKIIKSGTKDLALELEEKGYGWICS